MKAINMYTCHTRVKTVLKRGRGRWSNNRTKDHPGTFEYVAQV